MSMKTTLYGGPSGLRVGLACAITFLAQHQQVASAPSWSNGKVFSEKATGVPFFPQRTAKGQLEDPEMDSVTGQGWPTHVATRHWRKRRQFDRATAVKEVGYPAKSTGGLTDADIKILAAIYYEVESVYETGIGESTKLAIFCGVPRYTGVDGALEWVNIAMKGAPSHYRFHWADIGAIRDWANPTDEKAMPKWPMSTFAALAAESKGFEFYLVDGRFRVASVAACFLHAARTGMKRTDFRVGIHDFEERHRPDAYGGVLRIADIIDGFDPAKMKKPDHNGVRIAILRRKESVTDDDILQLWKEYRYTYK